MIEEETPWEKKSSFMARLADHSPKRPGRLMGIRLNTSMLKQITLN